MYILAAIVQRQLPCVASIGRNSINIRTLLDAKPVTKLKYQMYSRSQEPARFHGVLFKHKPFQIVFQPRRSIQKKPPGAKKITPYNFKDNVPKDFKIIYQSDFGNKMIKLFTTVGILLFLNFTAILFSLHYFSDDWRYNKKTTIPVVEKEIPTFFLQIVGVFTLGLVVFSFLLCYYIKLPVQRIYESPCQRNFIGIFRNVLKYENVTFEMSDVKPRDIKSGFLLKKGNVNIKGRNCLIFASDFHVPKYFNQFQGEDCVPDSDNKETN